MARDETALREVAEQSAAILAAAGMPKMPSRVLMVLTLAEDPGLTAVELAESLAVSAAAISGAVRYLQTLGMVRRVAQAGSRRDRYAIPDNVWSSTVAHERPVYRALAAQADAGLAAITDRDSAAAVRLREMGDFYRFIERRLPELMVEWEQQRDG
ncbi:MarR family transcriptional regulator [Microbacterium sp. STN6]|uniref:GbsR/MarR family transcriptional regulator n=1 Tax=Microbacterium sp. STN6 TaxID=2995588 RepID=UPI002260A67A|nr:MarR family transcriptional regulator [Microbacterium sp. STN6]MCX7522672.1 MarR family transcriptional regulator [Microbacterium sp. STN6]